MSDFILYKVNFTADAIGSPDMESYQGENKQLQCYKLKFGNMFLDTIENHIPQLDNTIPEYKLEQKNIDNLIQIFETDNAELKGYDYKSVSIANVTFVKYLIQDNQIFGSASGQLLVRFDVSNVSDEKIIQNPQEETIDGEAYLDSSPVFRNDLEPYFNREEPPPLESDVKDLVTEYNLDLSKKDEVKYFIGGKTRIQIDYDWLWTRIFVFLLAVLGLIIIISFWVSI